MSPISVEKPFPSDEATPGPQEGSFASEPWIAKAIQGDQKAYEALVRRYRRGLYGMIFQMVKNHEETEDLVQETFMKAFHALASYDHRFAFSTWLYKIAYNACIDTIRKRKLKTSPLDKMIQTRDGEMTHELPDDTADPETEYLYHERRIQLNACIERLPPLYRKIIELRHQKDKSYEEIAGLLNVPLGTVKARLFRAREMLKRMLIGEDLTL